MRDDRSDHELIGDVLVRYATGIDTKDWSLFRTCFTDDVHADYGDIGVWNGVDEITEYMTTTHARMPRTNHMMSNFSIAVDGDQASAASYVHVVLVIAEDPLTWIDGVGQYADNLVRSETGWRIRERVYSTTRLVASDPALLEQRG
jgi:3-phenylpropionate/cinnamic acid dioxygenase small subunit